METLEPWRRVWREGVSRCIGPEGLFALAEALKKDDVRLTQGSTTTPPPLMCVQDWPCEGACAIGFCGWQGENLNTVGEIEQYFARVVYESDQLVGLAETRRFLDWFDDTPRDQMRAELLTEVLRSIGQIEVANARY